MWEDRAVPDDGGKPDWELASEARDRAILARVAVPVFAVEGLPGVLAGYGGSGDGPVETVVVRHELDDDEERSIEVDTERAELDPEVIAAKYRAYLGADGTTTSAVLPVEGVDREFAYAEADDRWVAVGAVGDVLITVEAEGVRLRDVHLRGLANPLDLVDAGVPEYRPSQPRRGAKPVRDVLDKQRVADLAQGTRIDDLAAILADAAQPGLALLVSDGTESSWIGGQPHLPAETPWPSGTHGAMTFIAQLCLADFDASVWTGPSSGHLHVFCDVDPESNSIDGAGACAIVYTPAESELSAPGWPDDLHPDNRVGHQPVTVRVGLTLPDPDAPLIAPLGPGFGGERSSDVEALRKLQQRLHAQQGWGRAAGQVLGWPAWQNDDNTDSLASLSDAADLEWTLLLQTDALDAELYVVLPTTDLAVGRFDRAQATIEHD